MYTTTTRSRLVTLGTLLIALGGFAGCGGGGSDAFDTTTAPAASALAARATAPVPVQVKGCVVDEHFIPRTGTPVRLLSADGRLLGNTVSDRDGAFTFRVPAEARMSVAVDKADGERFEVIVGATSAAAAGCLRDAQA